MASQGKAMAPASAAKTSRPVTIKHLAARLAADHQLTKRAGEAILGDLVGLITKHLKKGERIRISGLGHLAGQEARRAHGPKSSDRRGHQDQGEQESRVPGGQGFEARDLTRDRAASREFPVGDSRRGMLLPRAAPTDL